MLTDCCWNPYFGRTLSPIVSTRRELVFLPRCWIGRRWTSKETKVSFKVTLRRGCFDDYARILPLTPADWKSAASSMDEFNIPGRNLQLSSENYGADGFTNDTQEVREQRIFQQALEGTRGPSTLRASFIAAPTSIQEALDRVGTIERVNRVLERDQQYRTREIASVQYRPLVHPQPFNRRDRYGSQRTQRPPYQKPHCYYCSLYGKRAVRGESATRPLSMLICPSLLLNTSHVRSPTVSGLLWSVPSVLLVDTGAACFSISRHRVPRQVLPKRAPGVLLVAANGTGVRSVGWLNVPVTLSKEKREHPMLIFENLPWDAILGIDFLITLQGMVNISNETLESNTGTIPFCNSDRKSMGVMATVLKQLLPPEPRSLLAPLMSELEATLTEFQDVTGTFSQPTDLTPVPLAATSRTPGARFGKTCLGTLCLLIEKQAAPVSTSKTDGTDHNNPETVGERT
ncbi:hypothetical protein EG68_07903 [Paragonimus skrjabini miyazakii]|uniref:Peptidase A2 domain-containing protein n=1 Tax=Paragonimus skrjabini miyazakii TaxID=59628 RepID=A0A8S9YJN2_9TREM|nr:hypothetical protein EG68_07903 [Paragonimus skrjabini miyazakii]